MGLAMAKSIKIIGSNIVKLQNKNSVANRDEYVCANSDITNGIKPAPSDLVECYASWPEIKEIADKLLVGTTFSLLMGFGGLSGSTGCACGSSGESGFTDLTGSGGMSLIFNEPDKECARIATLLGTAWMGCFWPDPMASFSCNCPLYGDMYENYLKYRLGSATFWNTPIDAPVQRQYFNESVKDVVEITVAGDFSQRPGDIVYVKMDNLTGLATETSDVKATNIKSGYYYVIRAKNTIKNDGGHTTILSLSKFTADRFYPPYSTTAPYESWMDATL
jgi:hypothetical protein